MGAPAWPPSRPKGGDLVRSQQMVAVAVWAHHAPYATHSAASAVLACASAVGDDFVLVHLHREAHLELFHWGVHGVADACLHGVDAVLIGAGAHATAQGLVADVALAGAGVLASEGEDGGGALEQARARSG